MIGLNSVYTLNVESVDDEKAAASISSEGLDVGFNGFFGNVSLHARVNFRGQQ
jgi:hypothetical protein